MLRSTELDARAAHVAALGELYRQHYLRLVRLAVQLVDDQASAEDLVQDVFARLQRGGVDLARLTSPGRYLTTAVVNQARTTLRHRRVVRLHPPDHPGDAEPADARFIRETTSAQIWKAITRLPVRQRQVVVLRYYENWTVAEIADALGITPGAASSSLDRARASLRTPIGALDAER